MDALHPLLRQINPSPEQIPAVLDRGRDVVVTAGAGTGKTRTLVARYLALLLDGLPLRSLVAITFTKKAAREMRNRVRHEMRCYLESPDLDAAGREHWQQLYTQLDAARIGTIHSLCGEILRHHPAEAGIDPRFEVLEEGRAALLQAQAVDDTLAWAANDSAGVGLFALLGERGLRSLVQTLLGRRLDVADALAALPADTAGVQAHWEAAIAARRAVAEQTLYDHPAFRRAVELLRETEPLDPTDRMAEQRALALRTFGGATHASPLQQINLSGGRQSAWPGGAEGLADVKAALKTLRDLWGDAQEWLTLELDALDIALAAQYPALRAAFDWASRRYTALKDESQSLDFDDLEVGAVQLLRDHPDVQTYWHNEIQALLVDEFQDTNHRQRDLLDLLNGTGGKLFIVGDAKQSIYRFRGADVTVFREKRQEIGASGAAYTLDTSYRAHRRLIALLNGLLCPVLGTEEDPARPYVEPFAPLQHHREDPPAGLRPPFVLFHIVPTGRKDEARTQAAQALAAWLVALVEGGQVQVWETDPDTGQPQVCRLKYDHVAILCRASGSFAAYEDALESAGIPFLTVAGRGFYDRPEVRDVLNALQAVADPTDDLALAGLLRSPAGGLSDMGLYRLCEQRQRQHAYTHQGSAARDPKSGPPYRSPGTLWDVLTGSDLSFLEEESPRAMEAREMIAGLHDQAGRVPVADVLKALLDETHYRAMLLRAGQSRAARNLAKLLADAQSSEIVGIGAFLEYVQQLRDVGTREGEAYTIAQGAVQLMTIHAAKGLEFPVVVIGDAARQSPHGGGVLVDPALGVLPPLEREEVGTTAGGKRRSTKIKPAVYRLAQEAAQDQESAESDRLLYVAATRAREMLVISGPAGGRGPEGYLERLAEAVPLAEAWDVPLPPGGAPMPPLEWDVAGQSVGCAVFAGAPELGAAAEAATAVPVALPEALPLLAPLAPAPAVADEAVRTAAHDPPQRVWRVVPTHTRPIAPAWVVGQIVHSALANWFFPDVPRRARFEEWAAAEARSCGLTDEKEVRNAILRAARMLHRFQETALYREMACADRRFHEVPYHVLSVEGTLQSGSMDAVFHTPRGWVLVEFKTDELPNRAALEAVLQKEDYIDQVSRYQKAATSLLGTGPRPILCFLNCGGEVVLIQDRWGELPA
jgi:ATP-dependent helicase/nuclease subunit A